MTTTILTLAANPTNKAKLRLGEEIREIEDGLRKTGNGSHFSLKEKWAVRPRDVQDALLQYSPNIIHFCGHGGGEEGIVFEDNNGLSKLVDTQAIADLFKLFSSDIECVVLNACYSEVQAKAIAKHIPYVIGMNSAIGDKAAIEFAVAFYKAIGSGKDKKFAYKFGCNAIQMANIDEHLTPELFIEGKKYLEDKKSTPQTNLKRKNTRSIDTDYSEQYPEQSREQGSNNEIFLLFQLKQENQQIISYNDLAPQQITPSGHLLPFNNSPEQQKIMASALLGDQQILQKIANQAGISNWQTASIRIRIMTDDPQLAMLPWHCMDANKFDMQQPIIEISPIFMAHQTGFTQHSPSNPLFVIPSEAQHGISGDSHYRLMQEHFESYFDIHGAITRVATPSQLQREIGFNSPDIIYIYAKYEGGMILLDNDYVSAEPLTLDLLADWLTLEGIQPLLILSLTGSELNQYPEKLIKNTRFLWIQQSRSMRKLNQLSDNIAATFSALNENTDIIHVIQEADKRPESKLINYFWVNRRSLKIDINDPEESGDRQLRAALLRIMLGRENIKEYLFGKIYKSDIINNSSFLMYVVTGTQSACPFDFPSQLQQRLQYEDTERSLTVIPFHFNIDVNPEFDSYDTIDMALGQGLLHGSNDINQVFYNERERRGLLGSECCINLNWLFKVKSDQQNLIQDWLQQWIEIQCDEFSNIIPETTVLLSAACIQIEQSEENTHQAQGIQDEANELLDQTQTCNYHPIDIEQALGKLKAREIAGFLRKNEYWRKQLKLDKHQVNIADYAKWIYAEDKGEFDPSVRKIWQQYVSDYQEYLGAAQ